MASGKERMRIERWINNLNARIRRQKDALTRLVDANIAMSAALLEIANGDDLAPGDENETTRYLRETAQKVLAVVAEPAAAAQSEAEELISDDGSADKEETNG